MHIADWLPFDLSRHNAGIYARDGEIVHVAPIRRKVCIFGCGLYASLAPLNDPEWEVWTCNLIVPRDRERRVRADRWFDLHQRCAQSVDDMRWIAGCPFPIYVPNDLLDASPNAVRYPLQEVEGRFVNYWACTFAYQIALALYEGIATDIGLYGVELAFGDRRERTVEWANVAYWVGRAEERGVRIHRPDNSTLGQHFARYGFEYEDERQLVLSFVDTTRELDKERDRRGGLHVLN